MYIRIRSSLPIIPAQLLSILQLAIVIFCVCTFLYFVSDILFHKTCLTFEVSWKSSIDSQQVTPYYVVDSFNMPKTYTLFP